MSASIISLTLSTMTDPLEWVLDFEAYPLMGIALWVSGASPSSWFALCCLSPICCLVTWSELESLELDELLHFLSFLGFFFLFFVFEPSGFTVFSLFFFLIPKQQLHVPPPSKICFVSPVRLHRWGSFWLLGNRRCWAGKLTAVVCGRFQKQSKAHTRKKAPGLLLLFFFLFFIYLPILLRFPGARQAGPGMEDRGPKGSFYH